MRSISTFCSARERAARCIRPRHRFSSTLRPGKMRRSSGTNPTPLRQMRSGGSRSSHGVYLLYVATFLWQRMLYPHRRWNKTLQTLELRRTLSVKCFDAFLEIFGLAQTAITMAFKFDGNRKCRVFGIVQKLLCRTLCEWRERAQFID